ncbi:MAG: hypothetical protein PUG02_00735 [Selenomonadaceae bacterium]|nr:hypothetical protein [Selenomonadaceae bacterium]
MSKWTDIRDNTVKTFKVDTVTEELKNKVTQKVIDEVIPPIEEVTDNFAEQIKAQAPSESGWCRIRDGIVLPLLLQGCVAAFKFVLVHSLSSATANTTATA